MGRSSIFLLAAFAATDAHAEPLFIDRSADLGIIHKYEGGWEYFVGGGVASFDCNGDFFPELFVAGGTSAATLLRNTTSSRGSIVTLKPDTPASLAITGVTGAYPLDINNDGILDLFVMRVGENQLLKGGPNCSFTEFDEPNFEGGNSWTTAFSATWEDGNTLPTLAIGNYVDRDNPDGPFEACDTNFLMRPSEGQFLTTQLTPGYCPLSMLFSDWGRKGRQDLRISNDRHYYVRAGHEQMWAMEEAPRLFNEADGWRDYQIWGMGIASRDITGDGLPEIFLTSMGDQKLQTLDTTHDGPVFLDATYDRGTTAHRPYTGDDGRPSTGWQVEFGDVNNDGYDDVFIAKGNVEQMPDSAMADPNNLLVQGIDGTFTESGSIAGIANTERSRGASLLDLNLDGLLDLVVVNRRVPVEVFQNVSTDTGNWLLLDIRQNGTNPQMVGGWVEVSDGNKTWHREITIGGGHASGNATLMHFGLGNETATRLRLIAPDGTATIWLDVQANQILQLSPDSNLLTKKPL